MLCIRAIQFSIGLHQFLSHFRCMKDFFSSIDAPILLPLLQMILLIYVRRSTLHIRISIFSLLILSHSASDNLLVFCGILVLMPLSFDEVECFSSLFGFSRVFSSVSCLTLIFLDVVPTFAHFVVDVFSDLLLHMLQSIFKVLFLNICPFQAQKNPFSFKNCDGVVSSSKYRHTTANWSN